MVVTGPKRWLQLELLVVAVAELLFAIRALPWQLFAAFAYCAATLFFLRLAFLVRRSLLVRPKLALLIAATVILLGASMLFQAIVPELRTLLRLGALMLATGEVLSSTHRLRSYVPHVLAIVRALRGDSLYLPFTVR